MQSVLTGILPTLTKADLTADNMVPNPRYITLNRVLGEILVVGVDIRRNPQDGRDQMRAELDLIFS